MAPRTMCDGENCTEMVRTDISQPYMTLNDGTKCYACDSCLRTWYKFGFLKIKPTEACG